MKIRLLWILFHFSFLISFQSCTMVQKKNRKKETQLSDARLWWNSLNKTWQIVFLREIDKIGKKPTDEDLERILNLEQVSCDHFPLGETNLDPLRKLKQLKSVSAGSYFIQNIDALADLDSLKTVILPDNHISSIEALRKHKMLEELYIQMTDVDNLEVLSNKTNLQVLVCFDTKIKSIEAIMKLSRLSIVQFPKTIDLEEIKKFKELNPDCDINL